MVGLSVKRLVSRTTALVSYDDVGDVAAIGAGTAALLVADVNVIGTGTAPFVQIRVDKRVVAVGALCSVYLT